MRYLILLVLLVALALPAVSHADEEFERNRVLDEGWSLVTVTVDYTVPVYYAPALHPYCTEMTIWYWTGEEWKGWFKSHPSYPVSDLRHIVGGESYWVFCQR